MGCSAGSVAATARPIMAVAEPTEEGAVAMGVVTAAAVAVAVVMAEAAAIEARCGRQTAAILILRNVGFLERF